MENKQTNTWKITALIAIGLLAVMVILFAVNMSKGNSNDNKAQETTAAEAAGESTSAQADVEKEDPLQLWTNESRTKAELIPYMEAITDETSADYIPPEDRVAVFDMDGTLCCETDPVYFDHMLLMHRLLQDPDYKPSKKELKVAEDIFEFIETGSAPEGLDLKHGRAVASSFAGMELEDFDAYVKAYKNTPACGYEGMTKGEGFYKPMLEIIDYLQANDFRVYIVSGTDRFIMRGLVDGVIDIPASQMIGSDERLEASGQGDEDGLEYTYQDDDELLLAGDFIIKNLKMNKVWVIEQEIGQQPVLAFGNSGGDEAMGEFVTANNPYKSLAFMLCCDDMERENGNQEKADKMYSVCEKHNWIPVSMKNDWTTIYGDNVQRKETADVEFDRSELKK